MNRSLSLLIVSPHITMSTEEGKAASEPDEGLSPGPTPSPSQTVSKMKKIAVFGNFFWLV